jgi:predicted metal-dependent hydrolase
MLTYAVRESRRARRLLLKADPHQGLVVVVPPGYDRGRIPAVLREHAGWIRAALARMPLAESAGCLPEEVELASSGDVLQVTYHWTPSATVTAREAGGGLRVSGRVDDPAACRRALRRWLIRRARRRLPPQLDALAAETGLRSAGCSIRLQRSRWGSCSPRGGLSLNAALLFLPPHLVRYVLIHELSHTRHLDHSPRFWSLVARHEPMYRERRRELAQMRTGIPSWVQECARATETGVVRL